MGLFNMTLQLEIYSCVVYATENVFAAAGDAATDQSAWQAL